MNAASDVAWLTLSVYAGSCCIGPMNFCVTENGNIGLFDEGNEMPLGSGDTCGEALAKAHAAFHRATVTTCMCVELEANGEDLAAYPQIVRTDLHRLAPEGRTR